MISNKISERKQAIINFTSNIKEAIHMIGSKLNPSSVKQYSHSFASIIADQFFNQSQSITGQEIVGLTAIKQVNFFVLKNLFDQWQQETKKFKSPYFNYKNEEVNNALKQLVNVLSKNISIQKNDFLPLLEASVVETLHLLFEPGYYFSAKAEQLAGQSQLKSEAKYYKLHKSLFEQIALIAETASAEKIQNIAREFMVSSEEQDEQIQLFNKILEIPNDLIKAEGTTHKNEKTDASEDLFSSLKDDDDDMSEQFQPMENSSSNTQENPEEVVENGLINLNDKFAEDDIKTLNDKYQEQEHKTTIAEQHEEKGVPSLTNSININQRYMFVNDLFKGNEAEYIEAIKKVDKASSFDDSVEILVQEYSRKYQWNMNSDEVKDLLKIIFKRFR